MLLVPRQLRRYGMTGDVPYYGGRLTPAHINAITHPSRPPAGPPVGPPVGLPPPPSAVSEALRVLLDAGVITSAEFEELRSRRAR
jgi:hypothetical protein